MTVTSSTNRKQLAVSGYDYDFDFKIFDVTEIKVYGVDSEGAVTLLTYNVDYIVSISSTVAGGTVQTGSYVALTWTPAEPATYAEILMLRNVPFTQAANIPVRGGFLEPVIEGALDHLAMQIQQLKDSIDYDVDQDPLAVASASASAAAAAASAAEAVAAVATIPDLASQAEAEAGTTNEKIMTALRTAQAIAALGAGVNAKVMAFSRDLTAASADVEYTGVGFTPQVIILLGIVSGSYQFMLGVSDGTTEGHIDFTANNAADSQTNLGRFYQTGSYHTISLKSFDSGAFTLSYVKSGTPTGTASLKALLLG